MSWRSVHPFSVTAAAVNFRFVLMWALIVWPSFCHNFCWLWVFKKTLFDSAFTFTATSWMRSWKVSLISENHIKVKASHSSIWSTAHSGTTQRLIRIRAGNIDDVIGWKIATLISVRKCCHCKHACISYLKKTSVFKVIDGVRRFYSSQRLMFEWTCFFVSPLRLNVQNTHTPLTFSNTMRNKVSCRHMPTKGE